VPFFIPSIPLAWPLELQRSGLVQWTRFFDICHAHGADDKVGPMKRQSSIVFYRKTVNFAYKTQGHSRWVCGLKIKPSP
jgi:hypothetical protein